MLRNRDDKTNQLTNQLAGVHGHFKRLAAANSRLAKLQEPDKVLSIIVKAAVQDLGFRMAFIGVAGEDMKVRILKTDGYSDNFFRDVQLSWDDTQPNLDPTGNCLRTLQPAYINLLEAKTEDVPYREQALARGFRSCAAVPLVLEDIGHGSLTVFSEDPVIFSEAEIKSLQIFSSTASIAYEAAYIFVNLQESR